jgi:hypothetical protein
MYGRAGDRMWLESEGRHIRDMRRQQHPSLHLGRNDGHRDIGLELTFQGDVLVCLHYHFRFLSETQPWYTVIVFHQDRGICVPARYCCSIPFNYPVLCFMFGLVLAASPDITIAIPGNIARPAISLDSILDPPECSELLSDQT